MAKHGMGQETLIAKNDIDYFEDDMFDIEEQNLFRVGVVQRAEQLNEDLKGKHISFVIDFVCDKFAEHNIKITKKEKDNTRVDIANWLTKNPPNDSEQSRPNVYKLCFALDMDAEQTEIFFLKNYLCRPFNFKDYRETVYYFCLYTHRSYDDAIRLIAQVESLAVDATPEEKETRLIGITLQSQQIQTESDFLNYMADHKYNEEQQRQTIYKEIDRLLDSCKKIANVKSVSALLEKIYGYNEHQCEKGISKSDLPQMVTTNFPTEMKFSEIKKRKASNDTCRKTLIVLYFYKFYATLYSVKKNLSISDLKTYLNSFEISLDELLEKCGYIQSYLRHPFDRLILYCANQDNPLQELKNIMQKYYIDVIDAQKSKDE